MNIRMPVNIDKAVRFANEKEILIALGIPKMEDPVMAGIIEMTNGQEVAIPIAMSYLAGIMLTIGVPSLMFSPKPDFKARFT